MTDFWVCGQCRSLNRGRSRECYSCHAPFAPYEPGTGPTTAPVSAAPAGTGAAAATAVPPAPAATTVAVPAAAPAPGGAFLAGADAASVAAGSGFPPPPTPIPTGPPVASTDASLGLFGGIVGGAIGAVISTALWYAVVSTTHVQAGLVAIAVGFIVANAVLLGAGRPTISLVPVSVAWTIVALGVAQYLITVSVINDIVALKADGSPFLPVLAGPDRMVGLVVDWFLFDPLTLLFWGIALLQAVAIPWGRATRTRARRWSRMPGAMPMPVGAAPAADVAPAATRAPSAPVAETPPVDTFDEDAPLGAEH